MGRHRRKGRGKAPAPAELRVRTVRGTLERLRRLAAAERSTVSAVVHEALYRHLHDRESCGK